MLYVFYGNDVVGVREKAQDFLNNYKSGNISVKWITPEIYSEGMFKELAGGVSLFGNEEVYVIDTFSEKTEMFEDVFSNIQLFAESLNTFVLIEKKLLTPQKKLINKYANDVIDISKKLEKKFNVFIIADALSKRDKKSLWILLTKFKQEGILNEEIIGILYWKIKMLRLAEVTKNSNEAKQDSFRYNQAKKACLNFEKGELAEISESLLSIYNDGHLGLCDFDIELERFVLSF